ncbi:nitroreductase family protein [Streptomyces sp. NPDC048279]|uniref:nitroreductase family protein n=1 Tax=Streptomyces sp. NPDC048279 TaxID=3154714 RepID=UPI0034228D84
MTELLPLNPDELLTTTRSVRKRLDVTRPVPLDVVRDALDVALQAPTGGNGQNWHWLIVTDPELRQTIGSYYQLAYEAWQASPGYPGKHLGVGPESAERERVFSSAEHLADIITAVPVLVIGAIEAGNHLPPVNQSGLWGSLLPAAWSLQLALRARGLGSAWTTLHLNFEQEIAELLGMPSYVRQGVLLPVAYTKGTNFRRGPRLPVETVMHVNGW